jgi:hypothetical protein
MKEDYQPGASKILNSSSLNREEVGTVSNTEVYNTISRKNNLSLHKVAESVHNQVLTNIIYVSG